MTPESAHCTTREVAELYGVSPKTIRDWVAAGRLTVAFRTLGGHARFDRSDIMRQLGDKGHATIRRL